jgi:guanylate kinase
MSPVSRDELTEILNTPSIEPAEFIANIMRRKLLHRTQLQKGTLSLPDLEDIEVRAKSAWSELQQASLFDHIIVNHDGEGHDNWDAFYYPIGDARKALRAFAAIVTEQPPNHTEHWSQDLFA